MDKVRSGTGREGGLGHVLAASPEVSYCETSATPQITNQLQNQVSNEIDETRCNILLPASRIYCALR